MPNGELRREFVTSVAIAGRRSGRNLREGSGVEGFRHRCRLSVVIAKSRVADLVGRSLLLRSKRMSTPEVTLKGWPDMSAASKRLTAQNPVAFMLCYQQPTPRTCLQPLHAANCPSHLTQPTYLRSRAPVSEHSFKLQRSNII